MENMIRRTTVLKGERDFERLAGVKIKQMSEVNS